MIQEVFHYASVWINMPIKKKLWIKTFSFLRVAAQGPVPAFLLSSFPLLGMLNEFELINKWFLSTMCFQLCVGRNFRKNIISLILQKVFFWVSVVQRDSP